MFMVKERAKALAAKGYTLAGIASRLHDEYRAYFFVENNQVHRRTGPNESEVVFEPAAVSETGAKA